VQIFISIIRGRQGRKEREERTEVMIMSLLILVSYFFAVHLLFILPRFSFGGRERGTRAGLHAMEFWCLLMLRVLEPISSSREGRKNRFGVRWCME